MSVIEYMICKYFRCICSLSIHSLESVFGKENDFKFRLFSFMDHTIGLISKNSLLTAVHECIVVCFLLKV